MAKMQIIALVAILLFLFRVLELAPKSESSEVGLQTIPATALIQCPALISLLRYQWTSDGWEDPLEAPDLAPCRGYVEEDCSDAFDDAGFSEWYFNRA